jgi:energy-coupling factor transport system ATP-binding protein
MNDVVNLNKVSFSYRNYGESISKVKPVLDNLSLKLPEGSKTLILAPPDGGKSTLSRILCSLIPKYLDGDLTGSCMLNGLNLGTCEPWDLVEQCVLVGQNPQEQLLMTTCEDEVAFPLESLGFPTERIIRKVRYALRRWDLSELAAANPQEMSGGERKRLLLAILDAVPAPLWILDEPFDDLDTHWREVLMHRIASHNGTVLVLAARYIDEFIGSFDRYGILSEGAVTFGEEQDMVMAYESLCDSEFLSTEIQLEDRRKHVLSCSDVLLIHPRKSMKDSVPFTLEAPAFELASEEIVSLVGPNGSGKSTFSRVLCGLDAAEEGLFSLDTKPMARRDLSRTAGYLFQNPDFEIFLPTVREELAWSLRGDRKQSSVQKEALVAQCARLFHLQLDENPSTMSYGKRKQLQAAVHYLLDRPFYILDELDSGVTYSAAFEMIALLRSRGAGILLITHDRSFSDRLAQRSYTIEAGRIVPRSGS